MVVPMAEVIVIIVSLVGEQGEAENERQRDAERHEEKIFQRVFLQEILSKDMIHRGRVVT